MGKGFLNPSQRYLQFASRSLIATSRDQALLFTNPAKAAPRRDGKTAKIHITATDRSKKANCSISFTSG